jgi:hypothetical protein
MGVPVASFLLVIASQTLVDIDLALRHAAVAMAGEEIDKGCHIPNSSFG